MKTLMHLPAPILARFNLQAFIAIRAAHNIHNWGEYATRRYYQRRGVPDKLVELAMKLEADI